MNTRLNVTPAERLRYSRRRLRALSRLRDAGIEPAYGLYKEHPLPTSGRRGYRVGLPDGSNARFARLSDIEAFAEDYRLWSQTQAQPFAMRVSFAAWQSEPMSRMLALVTAGRWPEQTPTYTATITAAAPTPAYAAIRPDAVTWRCSWPECPAPADGVLDGYAWCAPHALIYGQVRLHDAQQVGATS